MDSARRPGLSGLNRKIILTIAACMLSVSLAAAAALPSSALVAAAALPSSALGEAEATPPAAQDTEPGRSYKEYLLAHEGAARPDTPVVVFEGGGRPVAEGGEASWEAEVPQAGLYGVRLSYRAVRGKDIDIECGLKLDGAYPFSSAGAISLTRTWKDGNKASYDDGSGNEYRPVQVEEFTVQQVFLSAREDYLDGGYLFYLSAGRHTLTLAGVREAFEVVKLELAQERTAPDYEAYLAGRAPQAIGALPIRIEGEKARAKSHATLYSNADYSSCITSPYDARKSLQNTIGGESWAVKGQWLEWDFKAEKTGFYQLSFRVKQNFKSGAFSVRKLYLDGEVPFREAEDIRFSYALGWAVVTMGGETPQYVWLDEGKHTVRLEVAYGGVADLCGEVGQCVETLNRMYRKIMMITGSTPDPLRDYNMEKLIPESAGVFADISRRLYAVIDRMVGLTGGKGAETAAIEKLALQLKDFARDVELVPRRLSSFNANISSLAAWLATAAKQPLLLDYLCFSPVGSPLPRADAPWYQAAWNEVQRFFLSFIEDYDNIRSTGTATEEPVTLWLSVGRDQATVMQSIISGNFTQETGIPVNLRLIAMDVLMRAVAGGAGPDLALYQDQATAVNYALRGAAYDLNRFPDVGEVMARFHPSAALPFRIDDRLYALPEQMNYNVMFLRKDVMAELGLRTPETWTELYEALTVLQKNKLEIGVMSTFTATTTTVMSPLFLSFLYQYGGSVYNESGRECVLNKPASVRAFTEYCELYTKHGLSLKIDMLTRFRTGEAPIVVNNFTFGNELAVSAPELAGLWEMALLPGVRQEDGSTCGVTVMTSTGTVMFSNARSRENTWRFMKWWTGAPAQSEYARQIESTLGRSGRWTSANLEALDSAAWSGAELKVLRNQLAAARALPEVAGGYYTGRSVNNAIRTVVNNRAEPKETLYEYVKDINKEIRQKRKELGLD